MGVGQDREKKMKEPCLFPLGVDVHFVVMTVAFLQENSKRAMNFLFFNVMAT